MLLCSLIKAGVLVSSAGENSPHDSFWDGEGPRVEIILKCRETTAVCCYPNVILFNIVPVMFYFGHVLILHTSFKQIIYL